MCLLTFRKSVYNYYCNHCYCHCYWYYQGFLSAWGGLLNFSVYGKTEKTAALWLALRGEGGGGGVSNQADTMYISLN